MAEVFEGEDSDFGGGSGHHGSVFFPMRWVLQTPRIWNRRPHSRTDRSRPRSVPVNTLAVYECRVNSWAVGQAEVIRFTRYAARWGQGRIGSSAMVNKNSGVENR